MRTTRKTFVRKIPHRNETVEAQWEWSILWEDYDEGGSWRSCFAVPMNVRVVFRLKGHFGRVMTVQRYEGKVVVFLPRHLSIEKGELSRKRFGLLVREVCRSVDSGLENTLDQSKCFDPKPQDIFLTCLGRLLTCAVEGRQVGSYEDLYENVGSFASSMTYWEVFAVNIDQGLHPVETIKRLKAGGQMPGPFWSEIIAIMAPDEQRSSGAGQ